MQKLSFDFLERKIELAEDEHWKNNVPYCNKCHTPRYCVINGIMLPINCKCREIDRKKEEAIKQREVQEERYLDLRRASLLPERYYKCNIKNATKTEHNKQIYERCTNYVGNASRVLQTNLGLYIYGDNSSGKTHLIACVCNELLWQGYSALFTTYSTILDELRNGKAELFEKMKYVDFLFLDDIGKEFIGREYNQASAKYVEAKFFEVINARYNSGKPTIFSSNYSISDLSNVLGLDNAIVERINEMSVRIFKLEGDDFRTAKIKSRKDLAKELDI